MLRLVHAPDTGEAVPPPHPRYVAWIRDGALLCIKHGSGIERNLLAFIGDDALAVAEAVRSLRAQGVGPKRAAWMQTRLAGGLCHVPAEPPVQHDPAVRLKEPQSLPDRGPRNAELIGQEPDVQPCLRLVRAALDTPRQLGVDTPMRPGIIHARRR